MSAPVEPPTEFRRRLQHRQTTVIGGTLAVMAVLMIVGLAIWTGMLSALYEPGFSTPAPDRTAAAEPCPAQDAVTVDLTQVPVNVYNGTDTSGLAGTVTDTLGAAGITVVSTADWPKGDYDGDVMITAGPDGVTAAYSMAQVFSSSTKVTVQLDTSVEAGDSTVSIVLGAGYGQTLLSSDDISALPSGTPITAPDGCVAVTHAPATPAAAATE